MSWQRINENTYIDDTLVTCAEYQLFIDEMRDQGKYYQPDHWTSYQFPEGQAREPILGVRHSDTVAFCEWLTKREIGEWTFRVPKLKDIEMDDPDREYQELYGFWLNEGGFWWKGSPNNPRKFSSQTISKISSAFTDTIKTLRNNTDRGMVEKVILEEILRMSKLGSDQSNAELLSAILPLDIGKYVADIDLFNTGFNGNFDFENSRKENNKMFINVDLEEYLHHAINVNYTKDRKLVNRFRTRVEKSYEQQVEDDDFPGVFGPIAKRGAKLLKRATVNALLVLSVRSRMIDFSIDIFTLRERIFGRSPAFEGIRLVKERIT